VSAEFTPSLAEYRPNAALRSPLVSARWIDLVDPTREEVLGALPVQVDPEVVEAVVATPGDGRDPRPMLESHGIYVFGILVAAHPIPEEDRVSYQEIDVVATPHLLVTVRKTPRDGVAFDAAGLHPAVEEGASVGRLFHRLLDDVADTYLGAVDEVHGEIEELEDAIDTWPASRVRERISNLRQELLRTRRNVSGTRSAIRRILDGRVDVGDHGLFPDDVEVLFAETGETLLRVTEELDLARDLLAGVRDHHQSKVAEEQGDIVKKLTVIASLVLVPSLIVGFYGQNFEPVFDEDYWQLGTSMGLIVASTIAQLALYRWRRWI
jgi:magnesium transporter